MIDLSRRNANGMLVLVSLAVLFPASSLMAAESHDSHSGGHDSGKSKGKGKGGQSGHKDTGSSHSKETHDSDSHTGGSGAGGSKALENKVLRGERGRGKGPAYMGGREADADKTQHDEGESHEH